MALPTNRFTTSTTSDLGINSVNVIPKTPIVNSDFKRIFPTGISLKLNLPIVKTTDDFIFGVNLDGFVPQFNLTENYLGSLFKARKNIYRNLFPVQFLKGVYNDTTPIGQITQEICTSAIQSMYQSHRYVDGAVNLVVRLSANTSMTGNLLTGRLRVGTRKYVAQDLPYNGLEFGNYRGNLADICQESFAIVDLSLNRTANYTCDRSITTSTTDFAYKLEAIAQGQSTTVQSFAFQSQFTEDWLMFGVLANIPASQSNVLTLSFFFDYTNVTFEMPLLFSPSFPYNNSGVPGRILDVTASFINKNVASQYVFLPLPALALPLPIALNIEEEDVGTTTERCKFNSHDYPERASENQKAE